jgi:hypothetical protein
MKKSQKIMMAMFLAVLAGSLIVTGCSQDSGGGTTFIPVPGGSSVIPFDAVVTDLAGLTAALAAPDTAYIGVISAIPPITADLEIPEGKHVYLYASVNTGSKILTIKGSVVVAVDGSLTASASGVVKVPEAGSLSVEKGGLLSIDEPDSVNDGDDTDPATIFGTPKLAITGGSLAYTSYTFSTVAEIKTALSYVSSGVLAVTAAGSLNLKPSGIVADFGPLTSSAKRLAIDLNNSTAETETTLTIPAGLAIITAGSIGSVTSLTVYGGLTAAGSADADIKAGATVNGITFPDDIDGAAISAGNAVSIEDYDISDILDIGPGSELTITGDFGFVGSMGGSYDITGQGKIKTGGAGALNIGPHGGFTTVAEGVTGDDVMTAATGIIMEMMGTKALADDKGDSTITLATTFANPAVKAIGSVTIANINTPTTIQKTTDGGTGSGTNLTLVGPSAYNTFNSTVTANGDAVTGADAGDIKAATFTLTIATSPPGDAPKAIQIADSGFGNSVGDKYGVVKFSGVQLKNRGLIGPVLPDFHVGVKTER